jgi:hypothetical protein
MNNDQITKICRRRLSNAALPLAPSLRASIMNIPSKGLVPYGQPPGLRARIASCVETWVWTQGEQVQVGVAVNGSRMPDGQKALPLYMEGVKGPWRHPIFGDTDRWTSQPPHPYFWRGVAWYGPASRRALDAAAEQIVRELDS